MKSAAIGLLYYCLDCKVQSTLFVQTRFRSVTTLSTFPSVVSVCWPHGSHSKGMNESTLQRNSLRKDGVQNVLKCAALPLTLESVL